MDTQKARQALESSLNQVPNGPLGIIGEGDAFGAANYFIVSTVNGLVPISGVDIGFRTRSRSIQNVSDGELHTVEILASNIKVAEYAARFKSSPTNIDYFRDPPEIESSETLKERDTLNLYSVVVKVPDEGDGRDFRDADMSLLV